MSAKLCGKFSFDSFSIKGYYSNEQMQVIAQLHLCEYNCIIHKSALEIILNTLTHCSVTEEELTGIQGASSQG